LPPETATCSSSKSATGCQTGCSPKATTTSCAAQNYTNDRDVAKGGFGNDRLLVNDGDALDGAIGGAGNDLCVVDAAVEASYTCERVVYR
jgi:Ca2+-binding RTX toxin-like protein